MTIIKPMPKGGKREGAGRPASDPSGQRRGRVWFFLTPDEKQAVKDFIQRMRREAESAKSDSTYDA